MVLNCFWPWNIKIETLWAPVRAKKVYWALIKTFPSACIILAMIFLNLAIETILAWNVKCILDWRINLFLNFLATSIKRLLTEKIYVIWTGPESDPEDCGLPILCIFYVVIFLILIATIYTTIKGSKDWVKEKLVIRGQRIQQPLNYHSSISNVGNLIKWLSANLHKCTTPRFF